MRWIAVVAMCMAVSACAVASKTYGPNGQPAYVVNCSGAALNWGMCQQKAGDICQSSGYKILAINGQTTPTVIANPEGLFAIPMVNRTMEISCNAPSP